MSKERDVKRLRKSLHETQDILNHLIKETGADLEKKLGVTRGDAEKKLREAGKRFEKRYEETRSNLESTLKAASKDFEKKYPQQKKEAEKTIAKLSSSAAHNYKDMSAEAKKKYGEFLSTANVKTHDLKLRSADLLQGLAVGVLGLRNRLQPKKRLALRNENEKHHLGRGGYFKRFIALAIIIVSKKDRLLDLGQQAYHKLQDSEARQSLKDDALEQYDTMRRLIKAYANGHYKEFPYTSIVKIVAAIVYFVSVVDLIPDFIPVLGLTDDLAVLAWVYSSVKDDLQQFVDWEEANERRREKMENQKSAVKPSTPLADREAASPNAASPSVRGTTAPATTGTASTAGSASTGSTSSNSSSVGNSNTSSANRSTGSGSNTGSGGGNASSTSGSTNSGNAGSSSSGSGSGGNNPNQKSGGSSGSGNANSNRS